MRGPPQAIAEMFPKERHFLVLKMALLNHLERRFGKVPADVEKAVLTTYDLPRLDGRLYDADVASSLDEVGIVPGG
jgi:hypothetical protein